MLMAEYTADGPLTREQLAQNRDRLRRMSDTELRRQYDAAHHMCRLDREPPLASYVQQFFERFFLAWSGIVAPRQVGVR